MKLDKSDLKEELKDRLRRIEALDLWIYLWIINIIILSFDKKKSYEIKGSDKLQVT